MTRVTDESAERRVESAFATIRIDPHDGRCRGEHDIIVSAFVTPPTAWQDHGVLAHCVITWNFGVLMSVGGTEDFIEALQVAVGIAHQIQTDGEYRP